MNSINGNTQEPASTRIARWLADGATTVCVFENKDLGSRNVGHRFAAPYAKADAEAMAIGASRGPDTSFGLGWRYILIGRGNTVEEVERLMDKGA